MANTLADYLISIGFDVKSSEQQKLKEAIREGAFQANVLFESIKGAVLSFNNMMVQFADGLDQMYYASIRTQSTVQNIQALEAAAAKTGSSAEQANSALEGFAKWLRTTPGGDRLAKSWSGVNDQMWRAMDTSQKLQATITGISEHNSYPVQSVYMQMLGIPEQFWQAANRPEFRQDQERLRQIQHDIGVDSKAAAENAKNLNNSLRDLGNTIDAIGQRATQDLFAKYGDDIRSLQAFLQQHGKEIGDSVAAITKGFLDLVNVLTRASQASSELHAIVTVVNLMGQAFQFVADQLDRISHNTAAKAFGFVGGGFNGPLGIFGGINDLGADFNKDGSFGSEPTSPADTRNWWQRNAPGWLGGKAAPNAQGAIPGGASYVPRASSGQRAMAVMNRLVQEHRWTPQAASIAAANADSESNFNPNAAGDGGISHGLWQWNHNRFAALQNFAAKNGTDWRDFNTQVDFFAQEANRQVPGFSGVNNLNNAGQISWDYERYADRSEDSARAAKAYAYFRRYNAASAVNKAVAAAPSPIPGSLGQYTGGGPGNFVDPSLMFSTIPNGLGGGTTNNTTHAPTLNSHAEINIYGVDGGHAELGNKVASRQASLNADLIRNMQNSSVS